jgi:hypothetical protein
MIHLDHSLGRLTIYDQYGIIIGKRFKHIVTDDIAQIICIPPPATQIRLLPPGPWIASCFGAHPARLAPLVPK